MEESATDPEFLTVKQLAALLQVNRKKVYELVEKQQIPGAVRLGRTIRIHGPTVLSWVKGQVRVSTPRRHKCP